MFGNLLIRVLCSKRSADYSVLSVLVQPSEVEVSDTLQIAFSQQGLLVPALQHCALRRRGKLLDTQRVSLVSAYCVGWLVGQRKSVALAL